MQKKTDIYGVLVAGGTGTRMGAEKPKQFLPLHNKPILIHTLERFVTYPEFDRILILIPEDWISYTRELIEQYLSESEMQKVLVLAGGVSRNDTIMNAVAAIEQTDGLTDETIIVTHDAVRPFVTHRMIEDNIRYTRQYGACCTAVSATDTIMISESGRFIDEIPDRSNMYQVQTPQTFYAGQLREIYASLTPEEKDILTDATKILLLKGKKVYFSEGERYNIKVTYPQDIQVAEVLLQNTDN